MSGNPLLDDDLGGERSVAVRKLLVEARRALEFDRAHVVLVGDRATTRELPRLLADELQGEIESVVVRLAGREDTVTDCVAEAIRDARRQAPDGAEGELDPTAPRRARMALLLPDALSIPSASLRALNEMATRSGMTERLVLFVDRDDTPLDDPARELVARVGVGMSKIELEPASFSREPPRVIRPEEPDAQAAPVAGVPTVPSDGRTRRVRPVRVRSRRRPGSGHPILWILTTALLGGTALFLTAPGIVRHVVLPSLSEGITMPSLAPDAVELGAAGGTAEPGAVADAEGPELPPVGVPTATPARRPSAARQAVLAATADPGQSLAHGVIVSADVPTMPDAADPGADDPDDASPEANHVALAPVPVPSAAAPPPAEPEPAPIIVSFNAAPWADLEIDGRDVGPTPIGDLSLTPGRHHLRATFPDGRVVERSLRIDSLQNRFRIE